MQINKKVIKKNFEKSMEQYNENALVQKLMAEKLVLEISKFSDNFQKILELGCGTGLLTNEIRNKINFETYVANDLTERSKFYLDRILNNYSFIKGDASKIKSGNNFELVVSNAMFQWFFDLKPVTDFYSTVLKTDGILAFTTFSKKNFQEIKSITGLSLEYKSLDEIKNILCDKYEILYTEEFDYVMSFNSPLEVLAHMKNTGVNSLRTTKWSVADVKDFCEKYREIYPKNTLTYSPIIVIAKKNK